MSSPKYYVICKILWITLWHPVYLDTHSMPRSHLATRTLICVELHRFFRLEFVTPRRCVYSQMLCKGAIMSVLEYTMKNGEMHRICESLCAFQETHWIVLYGIIGPDSLQTAVFCKICIIKWCFENPSMLCHPPVYYVLPYNTTSFPVCYEKSNDTLSSQEHWVSWVMNEQPGCRLSSTGTVCGDLVSKPSDAVCSVECSA